MKRSHELNLSGSAIAIAAVIFFSLGAMRASEVTNDFVPVYAGASCMLHGSNPYESGQLVYPPSTLLVLAPLAAFPFHIAWVIWFLLNGGLIVTAVVLILSLSPDHHPWLRTAMGAVLLAGSSQLLILAQPSAFAIGLAAIGVHCFLRSRALLAGSLALMLSLAVKPQIGGLIALYLLFKCVHRRHVAMAMVGAAALLLCGGLILKVHPQSTGWFVDFQANLARSVGPGGGANPRPANELNSGDLNLQTVTSIFLENERAFNAAAYAVFGILLIAWATPVRRMKPAMENHLLSIGALSVLTLLPVYHRAYDSRLLILSIPAALIVYERRRTLGVLVCALLALTTISIQHWVRILLERDGLLQVVQRNKLLFMLVLRENNLRLLALSCLFAIALFKIRDREEFPPV